MAAKVAVDQAVEELSSARRVVAANGGERSAEVTAAKESTRSMEPRVRRTAIRPMAVGFLEGSRDHNLVYMCWQC